MIHRFHALNEHVLLLAKVLKALLHKRRKCLRQLMFSSMKVLETFIVTACWDMDLENKNTLDDLFSNTLPQHSVSMGVLVTTGFRIL